MIRHVRPAEDAGAICEIYNYYIKETVITFENNPIDLFTMQQRIERISSRFPYLVYEQNGKVLGYCYAATWRNRAAYNYTVEMTIYLDKEWTGRGHESRLEQERLWLRRSAVREVAVASITLRNTHRVGRHEKFGCRKVAHFSEVGNKSGKWRDVGFWEFCFWRRFQTNFAKLRGVVYCISV